MSDILQQGPIAKLPTKHGVFDITIFRDKNLLDQRRLQKRHRKLEYPIHSVVLRGG